MKPVLNPLVFSQIGADSGALTMMTVVLHKVGEEGMYDGTIFRGSDTVGMFRVAVIESENVGSCGENPSQANIDLKSLDLPVPDHIATKASSCYKVREGGYVVFHVSGGVGGYSVELKKTGSEKGGTKVFDSCKLGENDNFVATILRPGTYSIANVDTKAKAELVVAYPEVGKIPKQPVAIKVECTAKAINPGKIKINPTEPLMFSFKVPSRIKIELTKPDDGPKKVAPPKVVKMSKPLTLAAAKDKQPIRHFRINV